MVNDDNSVPDKENVPEITDEQIENVRKELDKRVSDGVVPPKSGPADIKYSVNIFNVTMMVVGFLMSFTVLVLFVLLL